MSFELSQLFRRVENLLRIGTIAQVDYQTKQVRVKSGDLLTDWLAWPLPEIGENFTRWRPIKIGTQVVLGCISGDPAQAVIIGLLYSDALNAPSSSATHDLIRFHDGTEIAYDSATQHLKISAAGHVTFQCQGDFVVTAKNVRLN